MPLSTDQYSYNNLTIGAGTGYLVTSITGLDEFTAQSSDLPDPSGYGLVPGGPLVEPRLIVMEIVTVIANRDTLLAAFRSPTPRNPAVAPFAFRQRDAAELFVRARVSRRANRTPPDWTSHVEYAIELTAPDPRAYGAEQSDNVTTSETISNDGPLEAWPIITINGPATDPEVTIDGRSFAFDVTLSGGESIIVDTGTRTVTGDATYGDLALGPEWAPIPPGGCVVAQDGAASIDVVLRPTFL